MDRRQLEEHVASVWARQINPSAQLFRWLPIGTRFRFVAADETNPGGYSFTVPTYTKTAGGWYETISGQKLRTGPLTAVLPIE
jgi:hypothetical protein